jgi:uncharacterized membrane protein YdbT with pleckstrin-like domain
MEGTKIIWEDRKRPFFGLPWSVTKYTLTEEKLLIKTGLLSIKEEEIQLYRITDISLKCSLWQRLFKLGTIHCCSGDRTTPEFNLSDVKNPSKVKELLSKQVEIRRDAKNIAPREVLDGARNDFHNESDNH